MTRVPQWTGFARKTLWDWLQLLIVPAILIAVTLVWSATQTRSDNDRRIGDATLEAYLDQMSGLILDRKLLTSKETDTVSAFARSVTLTALRRLDGERKGAVVRFLYETRLLDKEDTRVDLDGASLTDANLTDANLTGADLTGADLTGADLTDADLTDADLTDADLTGADLTGADLTEADLRGADLNGAKGLPGGNP